MSKRIRPHQAMKKMLKSMLQDASQKRSWQERTVQVVQVILLLLAYQYVVETTKDVPVELLGCVQQLVM